MKIGRLILLGAALGAFGHSALAFQEKESGAQDGAAKGTTIPGVELSTPVPDARALGQEIRVPGLGTIGVLPKLDFGLELLYGAAGQPGSPVDDKLDSGAQIRGTLKYRFPN